MAHACPLQTPRQCRPVWPKPPSARLLSSKDATCSNATCSTGTNTIWAMRSPISMRNGSLPRFQQDTNTCPGNRCRSIPPGYPARCRVYGPVQNGATAPPPRWDRRYGWRARWESTAYRPAPGPAARPGRRASPASGTGSGVMGQRDVVAQAGVEDFQLDGMHVRLGSPMALMNNGLRPLSCKRRHLSLSEGAGPTMGPLGSPGAYAPVGDEKPGGEENILWFGAVSAQHMTSAADELNV